MSDRRVTVASIAAVLGALGLCCGLPVLVSLGVLGAAAGLSRQSWALIGFGLVLAALGWERDRRRRRSSPGCDVAGSGVPQDRAASPDQIPDSTTRAEQR